MTFWIIPAFDRQGCSIIPPVLALSGKHDEAPTDRNKNF